MNCWPRFSFHLRQPAIIASIALMFYWFSYSLFAIFSHSFSCAKFKKTKKIFRKHRLFMLKKSNSFYYCYQFVHNISDGFLFGMQYAYFLLVSKRASRNDYWQIGINKYHFHRKNVFLNVFTSLQRINTFRFVSHSLDSTSLDL